ncbi:MAG: carboxylating nicotinate-nucleotide diphosphorylase [Candidatus Nitrosotenuis sp.]|nr:carboxylating nicotinate-nucleotide diphosphorylase [Candidatus Nitrosotenuis sp.]
MEDVRRRLAGFLREDISGGDATGAILSNKRIRARIISRQEGIVAGVSPVRQLFALRGCSTKMIQRDGSRTRRNQTILEISGPARNVLSCERTALNLLSRMSGIATATNEMVRRVKGASKKTDLYSTRKTAPGLRYFDKEAVEIGGGKKHRITLHDMIMIKDNHIAAEGSLVRLIQRAKKRSKVFEVEVDNTEDAVLAASMGTPIIMLDNFTTAEIKRTILVLKKLGLRDKVRLEASGGISHDNIADYARTGVDMISVGSITNSARAIDYSLEV